MVWKTKGVKFGVLDENTNKQEDSKDSRSSSSSLIRSLSKNGSGGTGESSKEKLLKGFIFMEN